MEYGYFLRADTSIRPYDSEIGLAVVGGHLCMPPFLATSGVSLIG